MLHFVKVSITVYIFAMFIYSIWYYLQVLGVAIPGVTESWVGSLCYLPHGARVLMFCYFRYYSIPALYLAELSGPALINHDDYIGGWSIGALGSMASVIIAVELIKWTRVSPGFFSFYKRVNFKNYKFVVLVIIISALLNGILVNSIISLINDNVTIDVLTVLRFIVGDILGAIAVIVSLWFIFRTLVDTRLIISPEKD